MRLRMFVMVLTALLAYLSFSGTGRAAGTPVSYWSPMEFGGGVELEYRWKLHQAGQKQSLKLLLEFKEQYDGDYDVTATLRNGKVLSVTERDVPFLISWAMAKMQQGQVAPTEDNLPMVAAVNLVVPSMMFFSGFSREEQFWEKGFYIPHPNLPGTTLEVTGIPCSEAGFKGRIMKAVSSQAAVSACISPQLGLPLIFTATGPTGETSEYILERFQSRKLEIPALFHKGEPDGFGGITWGTEAGRVKGLVFQKEDSPGVKIYRKKKETLQLWGVPFTTIEYYFSDGKFSQAVGTVTRGRNWERLKEALFREFGRGTRESDLLLDGEETIAWDGTEDTYIFIKYADGGETGTMTVGSVEMMWGEFDQLFEDLDQ